MVLGVFALEPVGFGLHHGLEIVVRAGGLGLPPLGYVRVVFALAGPVRGLVDRDLETRTEDDLARAPTALGNELGRDVAPPEHRKRGHGQATTATACWMAGTTTQN